MSLTKRDYSALAAIVARAMPHPEVDDEEPSASRLRACIEIAQGLADLCAANPMFDRDRFMAECGIKRRHLQVYGSKIPGSEQIP